MIRVLVLVSDQDGIGFFRFFSPHLCIEDPEIKVDIRFLTDSSLPLLDPNFIKFYNIIFYNKIIPFSNQEIEDRFYDMCKQFNIKIVYDIDDYFILDSSHPNYTNWKQNKSEEKIISVIQKADVVTTTTSIFADELRKYNKNVVVLPNAINIKEQQWISKKVESERIRFSWFGGISHKVDLKLLIKSFKQFDKEFLNKGQVVLGGYDLRVKLPDGSIRKDNPKTSLWGVFENIFTNDGKYVNSLEYRDFLKNSSNFDQDINYGYKEDFAKNEFYVRLTTMPIILYGTMYNYSDVALAPLKDNHSFNLYKSELKIVECGVHKMPLIASRYGSYTLHDIDGEKTGIQKGFYVDESKSDWYEKMRYYVKNPSAVKEHGEANYQYFLENFEMSVVNKKRIALYKEIATLERGNVVLDI